jgi:hypothetical protein
MLWSLIVLYPSPGLLRNPTSPRKRGEVRSVRLEELNTHQRGFIHYGTCSHIR